MIKVGNAQVDGADVIVEQLAFDALSSPGEAIKNLRVIGDRDGAAFSTSISEGGDGNWLVDTLVGGINPLTGNSLNRKDAKGQLLSALKSSGQSMWLALLCGKQAPWISSTRRSIKLDLKLLWLRSTSCSIWNLLDFVSFNDGKLGFNNKLMKERLEMGLKSSIANFHPDLRNDLLKRYLEIVSDRSKPTTKIGDDGTVSLELEEPPISVYEATGQSDNDENNVDESSSTNSKANDLDKDIEIALLKTIIEFLQNKLDNSKNAIVVNNLVTTIVLMPGHPAYPIPESPYYPRPDIVIPDRVINHGDPDYPKPGEPGYPTSPIQIPPRLVYPGDPDYPKPVDWNYPDDPTKPVELPAQLVWPEEPGYPYSPIIIPGKVIKKDDPDYPKPGDPLFPYPPTLSAEVPASEVPVQYWPTPETTESIVLPVPNSPTINIIEQIKNTEIRNTVIMQSLHSAVIENDFVFIEYAIKTLSTDFIFGYYPNIVQDIFHYLKTPKTMDPLLYGYFLHYVVGLCKRIGTDAFEKEDNLLFNPWITCSNDTLSMSKFTKYYVTIILSKQYEVVTKQRVVTMTFPSLHLPRSV